MKVVNPNNSTHSFTLIVRNDDNTSTTLTLTNEATKEQSVVSHTLDTVDGYSTLEFDFDFTERDRYKITLETASNVLFRGNIFATSQTPQSFTLTENYFVYE